MQEQVERRSTDAWYSRISPHNDRGKEEVLLLIDDECQLHTQRDY